MRTKAATVMMTADAPDGGGPSVGNIAGMGKKGSEKEVIHSGHFMVSDFEAEAEDDEENVLLEIPEGNEAANSGGQEGQVVSPKDSLGVITYAKGRGTSQFGGRETISIDSSLTKLFNAMSIAYRHKITSPKWNRFKGLKLRWKDKIRLNNVIWRCWHMQFIRKKRMTVCQFALDVDIHNKPEAIVLEGKYWKRQLEAVTAEYKKWRIYYRNKICGSCVPDNDNSIFDLEGMDFSKPFSGMPMSLEDGEISEAMDFTDVLFQSLISPPQAFAFPNPREIARGTENADFIQPGLIQLQPNLDDFMDIVEPLHGVHDILGRLSPETEMLAATASARGLSTVLEEDFLPDVGHTPELPVPSPNQQQQQSPLQYTARVTANPFLETVSSPTHSNHSSNHTNITSTSSTSSPHVPISNLLLDLQHPHTRPPQQKQQQQQQPPPPPPPQHHHSPVYRTPMPPLEHQQQQQLVSLPAQSPPGSYHHQSNLVNSPSSSNIHSQAIQLQSSASPLQLTQQQPLTPPQHQSPLTPPNIQQQSHTPPQSVKKEGPSSPHLGQQHHHSSHRSFIRSQSHHELGTQQQQPISSNQNDAFVIPKSYLPRRRSHSSGGSNASGHLGSPTMAPQQQQLGTSPTSLTHVSPTNTLIATSLPHLAPAPPAGSTATMGTTMISTPVITPVQATTTPGGSALLAQLLTSGSPPVNCSSQSSSGHHLATLNTSGQLTNLNNMTVFIAGSGASSSCSSGSNTLCSISSNNNSIKPGVSTSVLVSPLTLNAVTPSTLKAQPFTQVTSWSPCAPQGMIIKKSPPYPEPTSPRMMNVPSPPNKAFRPKNDSERIQYKEHRRVSHINAEQKRRSNLKNNFDVLHLLIPFVNQSPNAKISKAALLQKGADYIVQLKSERQKLSEQAESLRAQIEKLSLGISNAQAQLPATGAPLTHANNSKLKEMYNNYVKDRTLGNWKFWIFSLIAEPLFESYNNSVSTSSLEDLCRSSLAWLDQQCSLNVLRPLASNSMITLSTTTNVLSNPDNLPEEIYRGVTKQEGDKFCLHR